MDSEITALVLLKPNQFPIDQEISGSGYYSWQTKEQAIRSLDNPNFKQSGYKQVTCDQQLIVLPDLVNDVD